MKKSDITFQDKLNELRLDISHPNNRGQVFILVEGNTDIRLFRKFFDLNISNVENVPGGNQKLEECVSELRKTYSLIIGIRDADFIHLNSDQYDKNGMYITDYHDIEMTMLHNDSIFSALVFEYTDVEKKQHIDVRNAIFKAIEKISYLKWFNEVENLELSFSRGFQDLINCVNNTIDFNQYLERVISTSPNNKIKDINFIDAKLKQLQENDPDLFQLTNGHDFIKTLYKYFREIYSNNRLNEKNLESSIRIAFTIDHFKKTKVFKNTNKWAKDNNVKMYC